MRRVLGAAVIVAMAAGPAQAQGAPLHLRDAVDEALRHGPDLAGAQDGVAAAQLHARQASAPFALRWQPALTSGSGGIYAGRTYGVTVAKRLAATGTDVWLSGSSTEYGSTPSAFRDRGYSLGFSQPLTSLVSQAAAVTLENARRDVARSERDLEDARRRLIVSVADAFFGVDAASRLLDASRRAAERAKNLRDAARARAEAGLDTQLDVMRASLLVSEADAALGDRQDAYSAACERLDAVLGRPIDAECSVDAGDLDTLSIQAPAVEDAAAFLSNRADVQDSRDRIASAGRALSLSRWDLLPPLNLNVEYAQRGFGSPLRDALQPFNGWHVTLSSSYALDRASQSAAVAAAELAVHGAERDEKTVEARALGEIRQAARAVTRADQTLAIRHAALEVARQETELARLRYERGLADNFTVIDAENALTQAESASIAAEVERRLARLRFECATGTLDPSRLGS